MSTIAGETIEARHVRPMLREYLFHVIRHEAERDARCPLLVHATCETCVTATRRDGEYLLVCLLVNKPWPAPKGYEMLAVSRLDSGNWRGTVGEGGVVTRRLREMLEGGVEMMRAYFYSDLWC